MAITIMTQFESAVVEAHKELFTKSYIEDGNTIIEFDLRKRDYQKIFDTESNIYWPDKSYSVDIHEFSTFHNPIAYRFVLAQGYHFDDQNNRIYFTPTISEVSTQHHMSKNILRSSCFPSVICGVTLRNIAIIFSVSFRIPITKSSIKRWMDEIGNNLSEEEISEQLIAMKEPTQCHIDGYYPMGTDNCVMVIKDEYDRILITHETKSENIEEAIKFLQKLKDSGVNIISTFSDYSKGLTEAIRAIFPNAKFQADHFHTTKNIWKHSKSCISEYRKCSKAEGEKNQDEEMSDIASELWKIRWSLLKKPSNLTDEEKRNMEAIEKRDGGFVSKFRHIIRQIVNIFDHSDTEIQAEIKLRNLKAQINNCGNKHLDEISKFFDEHRNQAMQYLRKKGLSKYKRCSDSESGMRILRRSEKNHDGIRSEITRKNYIKIYQTIKYLSADVTDFLNPKTEFENSSFG